MNCGVVFLRVLYSREKLLIFKEVAILDCLGDSCEILVNNAACAHVCVADLRVAHLSVRKSDGKAGCLARNKRIISHKTIKNGCVSDGKCVVVLARIETYAVKDH